MAINVSAQSVRDLLDDVASRAINDDTLTANINRCRRLVSDVQDPTAVTSRVEDAIRAMSVWLTYGGYTEGISNQFGNISIAEQAKMDHFRKSAELFLNRISREIMDLDVADMSDRPLIGIDPGVSNMTTSEGYLQS